MPEPVSFEGSPVDVREDIVAAHSLFWRRLAQAGTWWSGAQRVAIAAEVRAARACRLCGERKAALSPHAVSGEHDCSEEGRAALPDVAIDAVHRVTTDASRLGKTWLEKTLAGGISDAQYIELVDVVVAVTSIDFVCRGLGAALHPLPEPVPGEPSRVRPASARMEEAWLPMIPSGGARGSEADLWRGRTGNVIRAMSLVPEAVRDLKSLSAAHYLAVEQVTDPGVGRTLTRPQIELLAARVASLNQCFY